MYKINNEIITQTNQISQTWEIYWNEYSAKENGLVILQFADTEPTYANSYTDFFVKEYQLDQFFNPSIKRAIQFGADRGWFLVELKEKEWDVIGYDYTENAIQSLKNKNIQTVSCDLNTIQSDKNELTYMHHLRNDLRISSHIFLIRVLDYLNQDARTLLLLSLIDIAQPGSVFFLSSANNKMTKNYILSFFAPRTDMVIKQHILSPLIKPNSVSVCTFIKMPDELFSDNIKLIKINKKTCYILTPKRFVYSNPKHNDMFVNIINDQEDNRLKILQSMFSNKQILLDNQFNEIFKLTEHDHRYFSDEILVIEKARSPGPWSDQYIF